MGGRLGCGTPILTHSAVRVGSVLRALITPWGQGFRACQDPHERGGKVAPGEPTAGVKLLTGER